MLKDERKTDSEKKQKILDKLLPALQETRALSDLKELRYSEDPYGTVTAIFCEGMKKVNVDGDSGISMIRDVLKRIV